MKTIITIVAFTTLAGCSAFVPDAPDGSSAVDRKIQALHELNAANREQLEAVIGPLDVNGDGHLTTGEATQALTRIAAQGVTTGDYSAFSLNNLLAIVAGVLGVGGAGFAAKKGAKMLSGAIVSAGTGDGEAKA